MRKILALLGVVVSLYSCGSKMEFAEYRNLNNGSWSKNDTIFFEFSGLDSTANYNLFLNVRNDEDYPFSNLFVITQLKHPLGKVEIDTLEYLMAEPSGEWLGNGMGSLKESKLWYKENIKFSDSGVYKVNVFQAMRQNGKVEGIQELLGITDVGLEIQKSK